MGIRTAVKTPATTKDKVLTAPLKGLISMIRLVPMTWEAVP